MAKRRPHDQVLILSMLRHGPLSRCQIYESLKRWAEGKKPQLSLLALERSGEVVETIGSVWSKRGTKKRGKWNDEPCWRDHSLFWLRDSIPYQHQHNDPAWIRHIQAHIDCRDYEWTCKCQWCDDARRYGNTVIPSMAKALEKNRPPRGTIKQASSTMRLRADGEGKWEVLVKSHGHYHYIGTARAILGTPADYLKGGPDPISITQKNLLILNRVDFRPQDLGTPNWNM